MASSNSNNGHAYQPAKVGKHARIEAPAPEPAKKRGPWFWVFVVAVVVFIGSLLALGLIAFSYFQGQQKYDRIADTAQFKTTEQVLVLDEVKVDWDALRAVNDDVVAWVYVPNTEINYPVVQAADNDYYLTIDFDRDQGWLANYGAIFMDYRNTFNLQDEANFIYGHHMQDGSMFAAIADMANQDKFDGARTVYLLTPEGNYKLRSFSLVHCDANEEIVKTAFETPQARADYVQDKIDRSVVDAGSIPQAAEIEKMFVLATCDDYSSGRFLLFCYPEDTTAADLTGVIDLSQEGGNTTGFANEVQEVPTNGAQQ